MRAFVMQESILGSTADKAASLANEAIGKAKQGIGSAVGSDRLDAEGAAQEIKGDAQKAVGDAKDAIKKSANKVADAINKNSDIYGLFNPAGRLVRVALRVGRLDDQNAPRCEFTEQWLVRVRAGAVMNKGGTNGTWDIALAARRANSHHHTSCASASLTSLRWLGSGCPS